MGYRERRAHKQQQKQQSLGQSYTPENRTTLPAPMDMSIRHDPDSLPLTTYPLLENLYRVDGGLRVANAARLAIQFPNAGTYSRSLITYNGSGSASAEVFLIARSSGTDPTVTIYDKTLFTSILVSASATGTVLSATASISSDSYFYNTEISKNIIATNGANPLRWNRADGWQPWSATASGDSIKTMWGINTFKSRIYCWQQESQKFWYSSTDQIIGTLNPFDLSTLISGNVVMMVGMNRDFSGGPDELASFITSQGEVVTYQGSDPSDANNWSLVGVYQIGKPLSPAAFVNHGKQTVVLCEDDFYFLPEDLLGKKQATNMSARRIAQTSGTVHNAVYWKEQGLLVFSDGTAFDAKNNMATTQLIMTSASPYLFRTKYRSASNAVINPPGLGVYDGKLWAVGQDTTGTTTFDYVWEVAAVSSSADGYKNPYAKIVTPSIQTTGRTNIALINPKFQFRPFATFSASASINLVYRTAIVYDKPQNTYISASSNAWITATASANSQGLWTPAFGTGDRPQIKLEVLGGTGRGEFIFSGIDITLSDTGGI